MAINWHHDLRPWLTLNRPRSRSQEFHFKCLENDEKYDVVLKGNQPSAFDWHYDL